MDNRNIVEVKLVSHTPFGEEMLVISKKTGTVSIMRKEKSGIHIFHEYEVANAIEAIFSALSLDEFQAFRPERDVKKDRNYRLSVFYDRHGEIGLSFRAVDELPEAWRSLFDTIQRVLVAFNFTKLKLSSDITWKERLSLMTKYVYLFYVSPSDEDLDNDDPAVLYDKWKNRFDAFINDYAELVKSNPTMDLRAMLSTELDVNLDKDIDDMSVDEVLRIIGWMIARRKMLSYLTDGVLQLLLYRLQDIQMELINC